jgi:hypothetical protein
MSLNSLWQISGQGHAAIYILSMSTAHVVFVTIMNQEAVIMLLPNLRLAGSLG